MWGEMLRIHNLKEESRKCCSSARFVGEYLFEKASTDLSLAAWFSH
jgi:hypothetical protein